MYGIKAGALAALHFAVLFNIPLQFGWRPLQPLVVPVQSAMQQCSALRTVGHMRGLTRLLPDEALTSPPYDLSQKGMKADVLDGCIAV